MSILDKSCAYVTLVMINPMYTIGAITLAQSLKKTETKYDIVCMVTNDIYNECKNILLNHFTYVISVEYIQVETKPFKSEKRKSIYESWIDKSYTKLSAMSLENYNKVCILDADMVIINNIDHLFELQTPVGVFSNHWFDNIKPSNSKPFYNNRKTCNYYINILHHELIPPSLIHKALSNNGFVASGNLMILKPDKHEFNEMISILHDLQPFGFRCSSGGDEQIICYYQSIIKKRNWTCLKQPYNVIPWKLKETLSNRHELKSEQLSVVKPYVIHFNMTPKPWETDRTKWIDNEIWWAYAMSIPDIKQICLSLGIFSTSKSKVFDFDLIQFEFNLEYCPYCCILHKSKIQHNLFECRELY